MMWHLLRAAAIARHRWFNIMFEGGDPEKWESHMALIRKFYGY